jgi:hypothetical protein
MSKIEIVPVEEENDKNEEMQSNASDDSIIIQVKPKTKKTKK